MCWMAWFLGCGVSGAVYVVLDLAWPTKHKTDVDDADFFVTFIKPDILESQTQMSKRL
jgi:hypothetical protein